MRATKSLRTSPISKPQKTTIPTIETAAWWEYAVVIAMLLTAGVLMAAWHHANGYVLYYGDAESHIGTARRILDSRTPGYDQIGSPWLPLPHVLMLPFVGKMEMWQSGMAGTIPGVACFILAGTLLFASARLVLGSFAAGLCAALLFALNPNLLYLQATPMSEPVYLSMVAGVVYFTLRGNPVAAALFSCGASMTRYEAWALIPIVVAVLLFTKGLRTAVIFGAIASIPPLYWFGHNWWYYGNPLEFYNGPYSHKMIYERAVQANMQRYPGDHDWPKALEYYVAAVKLCAGPVLIWLGSLGLLAAIVKRGWWAVIMLIIPPAFFVLSMHSSATPIYVPGLWPNSYYNTRYGMAALPLLAFGAAAIVSLLPPRWRVSAVAALVIVSVAPWVAHPGVENWITWKESQVNSVARREWTRQAADFFKANYRKGDGILFSFGDLTGVLREAGIPLRESLYDGNNPHFLAVMARPDLFMWEEWALAISGDQVATALQKLGRGGVRYQCVKMVEVKGAPAIEIYRRVRPNPSP
jgi:hypothetical protein